MNEHSSGTRADVPPSAPPSGTSLVERLRHDADRNFSRDLLLEAASALEEAQERRLQDHPWKTWGYAGSGWRWKLTPVRMNLTLLPLNVDYDPYSGRRSGIQSAPQFIEKPSDECPVCTLKGPHEHSVEDIERLRQMIAFLNSKLGVPPNGNARESASDAGSEINPDGADQGSVRNATDMVPFVDYKLARDALLYWTHECSGAEPSLSVFNRMVDDALAQNYDFDGDARDAARYRWWRANRLTETDEACELINTFDATDEASWDAAIDAAIRALPDQKD